MANTKSFNLETKKSVTGAMRRTFGVGISAAAVLSAAAAVIFAVALDGCSGKSKKTEVSSSNLKSSSIVSALPSPTPIQSEIATPKKKSVVKRMSTLGYSDSVTGVSFRYPRQYTLITPEKVKQNAELLNRIPMNFVEPGGQKIATVELPGGLATSLLDINVNKNLTAQQCEQFADPDLSDVKGDSPVDTSDESIPSKVTFHGMEFMHVENGTEQTDTRYYHHFENGACYEFVLAVAEKPGNTKAIDHFELFDKLERILASVQIKSEKPVEVTAGVSTTPTSESKPQ